MTRFLYSIIIVGCLSQSCGQSKAQKKPSNICFLEDDQMSMCETLLGFEWQNHVLYNDLIEDEFFFSACIFNGKIYFVVRNLRNESQTPTVLLFEPLNLADCLVLDYDSLDYDLLTLQKKYVLNTGLEGLCQTIYRIPELREAESENFKTTLNSSNDRFNMLINNLGLVDDGEHFNDNQVKDIILKMYTLFVVQPINITSENMTNVWDIRQAFTLGNVHYYESIDQINFGGISHSRTDLEPWIKWRDENVKFIRSQLAKSESSEPNSTFILTRPDYKLFKVTISINDGSINVHGDFLNFQYCWNDFTNGVSF